MSGMFVAGKRLLTVFVCAGLLAGCATAAQWQYQAMATNPFEPAANSEFCRAMASLIADGSITSLSH
jgi:hypothetical protein